MKKTAAKILNTSKGTSNTQHEPETEPDQSPDCNITFRNKHCKCLEISRSFESFRNEFKDIIATWKHDQATQLQEIHNSISGMNKQISEIQKTNKEIEKSIDFLSSEYDIMKNQIKTLEEKGIVQESRIKYLEDTVEEQSRKNNLNLLEIRNIPQQPKESFEQLLKITTDVFKVISANVEVLDILDIRRLPSKSDKKTILVTLKTVILKNSILQAVKAYNVRNKHQKLNTSLIAFNSTPETIYIDEHLTQKGKRLYYLARQLSKSGQFQYCWTTNARVLLREKEGEKAIVITDENQINELKTKIQK